MRARVKLRRLVSRAPLLALVAAGAACSGQGSRVKSAEVGAFRATGVGAAVDPTVKGARLLPESVDETGSYGTESGGGVRAITAGLRVVASRDGAIVAADDRLPQGPQITAALPERLGGGFLFVLGPTVWRADRWLGPASPIFTSGQQQSIQAIVPGLDRVYVRTASTYLAIDGKSGRALDLGPWPASPYVASYAAADGWRAAAVTDLRGVVATSDAGATWRALDLPLEPRSVVVSGDNLAIGGLENGRTEAWFEVRADGSVARLGGAPREAKAKIHAAPVASVRFPYPYPSGYPGSYPVPPPHPAYGSAAAASARPEPSGGPRERENEPPPAIGVKIFGKRPLAAAIEDGWPLTDGTAVVARDGALGRVRLSDGALTEIVQDAYPLKPSRCHPVSLTRANAIGAFGFVCGEPRGTTVIYAYEPLRGRLSEIKRFEKPRVVTSAGNGALAVRGSCAEDADPPAAPRVEPLRIEDKKKDDKPGAKDKARNDKARTYVDPEDDDEDDSKKPARKTDKDTHAIGIPAGLSAAPPAPEVRPYCVLGHDNVWREVHVRGDASGERVVVLADGKIAVVSPPQGPNAPARLTLLDKGKATTVAITYPKVTTDVARVLRLGLWLDGFEERRPGVVGGWIEAGGSVLGIEIALDGKATLGQYIRDAGAPFVSGKYGFGWTPSRRGYETTDGGMTWAPIDLPDPLATGSKIERRACGPIGCVANGWMRVGWGEIKKAPSKVAPPPFRATTSLAAPQLAVACEPVAGSPPAAPPPKTPRPTPTPPPVVRRPYGGPPVLGGFNGVTELPAFFGQAAQTLREGERGLPIDIRDLPERYPTMGQLGRIYAWGPKTGEWDTLGRWQVKWISPFSGWNDLRSSVPVLPPQVIVDVTRASSTYGYGGYYGGYGAYGGQFQLVPGDDGGHALLVGRRTMNNQLVLFELEGDRAPIELHRADGEPFGEIEGYVRAAGRWFLATPLYGGAAPPATVIWQVDGANARELVRVPRAGIGEGGRSANAKLARRSDGRAIGLVVDGQPTAERPTPVRWVLPIDLDSGQLGEPEPLGYTDLAGRTLDGCSDDVVGWVLDAPLALGSNVRVKLPSGQGALHSVYGRVRLTGSRACIERIAGTYDGQSTERAAQLTRPGAPPKGTPDRRPGEIMATAMSAQTRYALRCTIAK